MMNSGLARPLCVVLSLLAAAPGFGQAAPAQPPAPQTQPAQTQPAQTPPTQTPPAQPAPPTPGARPVAPQAVGDPLRIVILEGNNAINSIPLLRSVAAVVEIRDPNDFPIEGASVTFSLPELGAGGVFSGGGASFSTRTDSHGQASAPLVVPRTPGKFQIKVVATSGIRKGEAVVDQTNSTSTLVGTKSATVKRPWYKKPVYIAALAGGAAAIILVVVLVGRGSSKKPVIITPGTPVFQ